MANYSIRKYCIYSLIAVVPLGFLFKFYSGPGRKWFNDYGAGLFYEIFWILIVFLIFPKKKWVNKIPLWVFLITCALEILEGLKLQQTEFDILLQYGHSIKDFIKLVQAQSFKKAISLSKSLDSLKKAKVALAKEITPEGIESKDFEDFINASQNLFDYENIEAQTCPFCRRVLDEKSIELVKSYHKFLIDEIGDKLKDTTAELNQAFSHLIEVKNYSLTGLSPALPIVQEVQNDVNTCIQKNQYQIDYCTTISVPVC